MGKAEEAVAKRRIKANRKRERRFSSQAFPNALIAAKRRRKAGTRRICEGMCYTLPTLEDPFNDRAQGKRKKKRSLNDLDIDDDEDEKQLSFKRFAKKLKTKDEAGVEELSEPSDDSDTEISISTIATSTQGARDVYKLLRAGKPNKTQLGFWEACQKGLDVIGNTPASYYVPAAVNHIAKRSSKAGKPMVLFLVPSQQEALAVRSLCKPLKELLGVQSVSIHPGASIDHQAEGLAASSFQILVATPERLSELLSRNAVNLSRVSFLILDNVDEMIKKGLKASLQIIKSRLTSAKQVVVSSESFNEAATNVTREFIEGPAVRVSSENSLKSNAACISQDVSVIVNEKMKLPKVLSIVKQHQQEGNAPLTLIIANNIEDGILVTSNLEDTKAAVLKGDNSSVLKACEGFRNGDITVLVAPESLLRHIDLSRVKIVINYDSPSSIQTYCTLLVSMARTSVRGCLYTLCACSSVSIAGELVKVLNDCSQPVPTALQMLADAASVVMRSKTSR